MTSLQLARGYFESIQSDHDLLIASGWMMCLDCDLTVFQAYMNGKLVATVEPQTREDVGKAFWWIPHAARSGFRFVLPETDRIGRVEVLGLRGYRRIARLESLVRPDLDSVVPAPPPQLMARVAGNTDLGYFKANGLKSFTEFSDAIHRHGGTGSIRRMLDWGCGCGRVTAHFLLDGTVPEILGCDIDGEAIAWCRENLPGGNFRCVNPWPPTLYEDQSFDLVIAYSVFTHLTREAQEAWLAEMRRVTRPGGLFLASVHGEFAASTSFPRSGPRSLFQRMKERFSRPRILREEISDTIIDHSLDGIAPEGYYRGVFQTRHYTISAWSKHFEVLEYTEGGIGNFQDLVVMRRRD